MPRGVLVMTGDNILNVITKRVVQEVSFCCLVNDQAAPCLIVILTYSTSEYSIQNALSTNTTPCTAEPRRLPDVMRLGVDTSVAPIHAVLLHGAASLGLVT